MYRLDEIIQFSTINNSLQSCIHCSKNWLEDLQNRLSIEWAKQKNKNWVIIQYNNLPDSASVLLILTTWIQNRADWMKKMLHSSIKKEGKGKKANGRERDYNKILIHNRYYTLMMEAWLMLNHIENIKDHLLSFINLNHCMQDYTSLNFQGFFFEHSDTTLI